MDKKNNAFIAVLVQANTQNKIVLTNSLISKHSLTM